MKPLIVQPHQNDNVTDVYWLQHFKILSFPCNRSLHWLDCLLDTISQQRQHSQDCLSIFLLRTSLLLPCGNTSLFPHSKDFCMLLAMSAAMVIDSLPLTLIILTKKFAQTFMDCSMLTPIWRSIALICGYVAAQSTFRGVLFDWSRPKAVRTGWQIHHVLCFIGRIQPNCLLRVFLGWRAQITQCQSDGILFTKSWVWLQGPPLSAANCYYDKVPARGSCCWRSVTNVTMLLTFCTQKC